MNFKRKDHYDKKSTQGIVYSAVAIFGITYEIFFSTSTRPFLIIMYLLALFMGGLYIWVIEE